MSYEKPIVCALCRKEMPDIDWTHPCPHWMNMCEHCGYPLVAGSCDNHCESAKMSDVPLNVSLEEKQALTIERLRQELAEARAEIERLKLELARFQILASPVWQWEYDP